MRGLDVDRRFKKVEQSSVSASARSGSPCIRHRGGVLDKFTYPSPRSLGTFHAPHAVLEGVVR